VVKEIQVFFEAAYIGMMVFMLILMVNQIRKKDVDQVCFDLLQVSNRKMPIHVRVNSELNQEMIERLRGIFMILHLDELRYQP